MTSAVDTSDIFPAAHRDRPVLDSVRIDAEITGLFAEITIAQRYRNAGETDIEALYTFPMPVDATLLSFEAEIGDTRRRGQIVPARAAEDRYEDAVSSGDAAVLLEQVEPGMFTASLGNLRPGEIAVLHYRYALLLRWNGDRVRLALPTTIAPRYGRAAHVPPHQEPAASLAVENRFSFGARIHGPLAKAEIHAPTHDLQLDHDGEALLVRLEQTSVMDRDLVIEARLGATARHGAVLGRDGDRWLALASFRPDIPVDVERTPGTIQIIVDCSGSMNGDSIAQARLGVMRIIDSLPDNTDFNIIAFGSNWRALFERPMPVTRTTRHQATTFARGLEADMGGTEMGRALNVACAARADRSGGHDILLITDGETWGASDLAQEARDRGHRIFTIGVGSAAAETTVRQLASATGGACEMVTPTEDMNERIHRHFCRILAATARTARVTWPIRPVQEWPAKLGPVHDGDTVHAFAWFDEKPAGMATLELAFDTPGGVRLDTPVDLVETTASLSRIAAAQRIAAAPEADEATDLALTYQLLSRWTKCIVTHPRAPDDKADGLPETIKVQQTLAAGWHGMGRVRRDVAMREAPTIRMLRASSRRETSSSGRPMFFIDALAAAGTPSTGRGDLDAFLRNLKAWTGKDLPTIKDLRALALPVSIARAVEALLKDGEDETDIVLALLQLLVQRKGADLPGRLGRLVRWRCWRRDARLAPARRRLGAPVDGT